MSELDVCEFLSKHRNQLLKISEETLNDYKEHGASFCKFGEVEFIIGEVDSSDESTSLQLCPPLSETIGVVHTHPQHSSILPSELDIASTLEYDLNFSCILDPTSNQAVCLIPNKSSSKYNYYKHQLLDYFDKAIGSSMRGNFEKASKYVEDFHKTLQKALDEGVVKLKVCKL